MDMDARIKVFVSQSDNPNGSGSDSAEDSDYGSGYDDGNGYDIESFCGHPVYLIDGSTTIIFRVKGNTAKRAILRKTGWSLCPCRHLKRGLRFSSGKTV